MPDVDRGCRSAAPLRVALVSLATLAASTVCGLLSSPALAGPPQVCWSPAALRFKPGEAAIATNVPQARVAHLRNRRDAGAPAQLWDHRPIRRVNLPPGSRKLIALTFDLCEQPHEVSGYQGAIVDYLRDQSVRATFFSGGKWLLTHQERAQQIMAGELFEIGNHTWEHRNLRVVSPDVMRSEIWQPQYAYAQVRANLEKRACLVSEGNLAHQVAPSRMALFRFPFGACNPESMKAVQQAGLRSIQWDVSSGDAWKLQTADRMVRDVLKHVSPGSIVLFHANGRGWHTSEAVPRIVKELRARGYELVTVSELLSAPGAQPVYSDTCYDFKPGDTDRYDALALRLEQRHGRSSGAASARPAALTTEPVTAKKPDPASTPASTTPARTPTSTKAAPKTGWEPRVIQR